MIEVTQIPILEDNYTYILHEKHENVVGCLDPGESEPILEFLSKKKLKLDFIFNTHHHYDHVGGNLELKKKTNCEVIGSEFDKSRIPGLDIGLKNRDLNKFGQSRFVVIETPGHTLGHITFYFKNDGLLFCGDTLFSAGCGRIFEGTFKQMWDSLKLLRALPDNTLIYCGHEYTLSNLKFAISLDKNDLKLKNKFSEVSDLINQGKFSIPSTIREEKKINPFLKVDKVDFLKKLNFNNTSELEIFEKIRKMKDDF